MRTFLTLFFGVALGSQAAQLMTVNFTSSIGTGMPGQVVNFSGTLTNNDSTADYINEDIVTIALPVDDSTFLLSAPFPLPVGGPSSPLSFFDIMIPVGQAAGTYNGTFQLFGGADGGNGSALGPLTSASFSVQVVPEPSTMLLLGAGLVLFIRRKR